MVSFHIFIARAQIIFACNRVIFFQEYPWIHVHTQGQNLMREATELEMHPHQQRRWLDLQQILETPSTQA
jgi:hypothetical protein